MAPLSWIVSLALTIAAVVVISTFGVYVAFFALSTAKRIRNAGEALAWDMKVVCFVLAVIGYPADWLFNWTRGVWMFKELPPLRRHEVRGRVIWLPEILFTSRVQRHIDDLSKSKRPAVARRWARILVLGDEGHIDFPPGYES